MIGLNIANPFKSKPDNCNLLFQDESLSLLGDNAACS